MPKHALTFKHLVGSVTAQRKEERRERSVNELLSSSRQTQVREQPPHVPQLPLQVGPDSTSIHPAELLRREQQAHYRAARSVAGPAPPRSWRPKEKDHAPQPLYAAEAQPSPEGLEAAAAFLSSPRVGPSLLDTCARLILRLLRDTTVIYDDEEESISLADAVLAGACELDGHLRGLLISTASLSGTRLADRQLRALLEYSDGDASVATSEDPEGASQSSSDIEWDTDAVEPLTHLSLALHPNPLSLVRDAPHARLLALTSLDLAYATLPELDRLVSVLPAGLRVLGLAGVRARAGYDGWLRGLALMARKLILLHTLDLSHLPIDTLAAVNVLFQSSSNHLPSLRVLGLRGVPLSEQKEIRAIVNRGRGGRWIEVVF